MAWTREHKLSAAMMVVTLFAAVAAWIPPVREYLAVRAQPTATFLEPLEGQILRGATHSVHGKARNVSQGEDIWLVIRIASGLWFPVEKCDLASDGSWSFRPDDIHLGANKSGVDLGVYTLSLYLVRPAETEPFQAYVRGRDAGHDSGLMSLPGGVVHLASINVSRAE